MRLKVSLGVLLLMAAGALFAQTERATLRGTVNDPSGAVVASATVVVTEVATNVEARRVTTDENGNYEVPDLRPTVYRVGVDVAGFKKFFADGVLLDPGQSRRLDVKLTKGPEVDKADAARPASSHWRRHRPALNLTPVVQGHVVRS